MKLISKTIIGYLIIGLPLLLIGGVLSYFLIKSELRDGVDENLEREKLNVQRLIESLKTPENTYLAYDSLSFIKVMPPGPVPGDVYSDTCIHRKKKKTPHNYRVLKSVYIFNNTHYQITLARTTQEEEELMDSLFSAFILVLAFLILSFFMVSWLLSKKLWHPFYKTLSILGRYDLNKHATTHFPAESTTEFNRLNAELNKMTEKIHRDFIQQKEFTENAAHEMQTPLAVVRANLSLMMQSPNMQESEMGYLEAIENTIKRLTTLNKTLLLLAKIENNQYHEIVAVSLKEKVEASLDLFADILQARNITVATRFEQVPVVQMNTVLADILVNNLLQNAIRHNVEGGEIKIFMNEHSFAISNTGAPLTISEEELFVRFKKNDGSRDSLGLGLSIVKSIVGLYHMQIRYSYSEHYHTFSLQL